MHVINKYGSNVLIWLNSNYIPPPDRETWFVATREKTHDYGAKKKINRQN